MTVQRQQERKAAAVNTLKESAFAEAHHTLAGTGEIGNQVAFVFGSIFSLLLVQIMDQSVAGQFQTFHQAYHLHRIEPAILVAADGFELYCFGYAVWEIRFVPILKLQVLTSILGVGLGIVVFDEGTGTADQKKFH